MGAPGLDPAATAALAGDGASAPLGAEPPIGDDEPTRRWYGWQTLAFDVSAIAVLAVADATESSTDCPEGWNDCSGGLGVASALGLATYLLATPLVHVMHDNPGRGALSLVARVAVPIGLIYAADSFEIAGVGALGVIALDSLIARERVEESSPTVTPIVSVGHGGAVFGLAGAL